MANKTDDAIRNKTDDAANKTDDVSKKTDDAANSKEAKKQEGLAEGRAIVAMADQAGMDMLSTEQLLQGVDRHNSAITGVYHRKSGSKVDFYMPASPGHYIGSVNNDSDKKDVDLIRDLVNVDDIVANGEYLGNVNKLDLMGGETSKLGGDFVNHDIVAKQGINGEVDKMSKIIKPNSVDEIVTSNPFNPDIKDPFELYIKDSYNLLKKNGTLRINGQYQNPLFRKISKEECEKLGFEVLEFKGPLTAEHNLLDFYTTQGNKISNEAMFTIFLRKNRHEKI